MTVAEVNHYIMVSSLRINKFGFLAANENDCVYTVYVRTGTIWKGGTDSIIGVKLYDAHGGNVEIPNLESWGGLMESGHNYFERGNLDIFSGRAACLDAPVCALNLTSDGSGPHHGWYCNYVEVTSTGPHNKCQQKNFEIEQWLASDAPPYVLSTIRNYCQDDDAGNKIKMVI
ncbi:PLAT domain-containing protein 3-like [Rutidosis leptorrhynchoides]|uniref:PLAT domain-containing protein 3-like n=1 Tax=Rutidosis leptorrhynchoides TaxID=125765 RepID=UPI003A9A054B